MDAVFHSSVLRRFECMLLRTINQSGTLSSFFVCYMKLKKIKPVSQFPLVYTEITIIKRRYFTIY